MRAIAVTAAAALFFVAPASAQPYSASMADCAALYQNAAQWVRTDASSDKLMKAASIWADASISRARAEGIANPKAMMWKRIDQKTEEWEAKGKLYVLSEDFRDWTAYCRKFAKSQGIKFGAK